MLITLLLKTQRVRGVFFAKFKEFQFIKNDYFLRLARTQDEVAEWLRRWTANPLGSARVGSNPILVELSLVLWCNG